MSKVIGQIIKHARKEKKITQLELGLRLGYQTGQLISNVERGTARIPLAKFRKLCAILKLSHEGLIELQLNEYREKLTARIR